MKVLSFDGITKTYGTGADSIDAVKEISFTLDTGAFTIVRGPSGCGKTTLLLIAGGLLHPTAGSLTLMEESLYAMNVEKRAAFRARNIGFVFQQFHLIPYLTVLENTLAPCYKGDLDSARLYAEELLHRFGLERHANKPPATLSTGERQRVALIRALINRPKLLLADEPTGNLDEENGRLVLDALADFAAKGGAVLLVTHDRNIPSHSGQVLEMRNGSFNAVSQSAVPGGETKQP